MKRPRQHEIDQEAQGVLRELLPTSWVCNPFLQDYGKDYLVELVDNGELTGKAFVVQLKGTESPQKNKRSPVVSFSLENKYLRYYVDKVELPVFLVVADVVAREAFWLFVQEYVEHDLQAHTPNWHQQDSASLHIPIANNIRNEAMLRAAVDSALNYMKSKYPGKVEDAIAAARLEMERQDPRIGVEIEWLDGKPVYSMIPREDLEFKLHLSGDKEAVAKKYREIVDEGRLVDLSEVSASITGLPSISQQIAQFQVQKRLPMEARITLLSPEGSELARLDPITGTAVGGMTKMRLSELLGQSILMANATITLPSEDEPRTRVDITPSFDMSRWSAKRVLALPYFEQVDSLVQHLMRGGDLRLLLTTQGNELFDMRGQLPVDDVIRQVAMHCLILRTARDVARWTNIDPLVPRTMTPEETDDLLQLAELLDPNRRTVPYAGMELVMEMPRERVRAYLQGGNSPFGSSGSARVESKLPPFSFLGVPVEVYGFTGEITNVQLQQTDEDMHQWLKETTEPVARVKAISAPTATLTKCFAGVRQLVAASEPDRG